MAAQFIAQHLAAPHSAAPHSTAPLLTRKKLAATRNANRILLPLVALLLIFAAPHLASAQRITVLHRFKGGQGDGYNPFAPVVSGPDGTLYGTTYYGGNLTCFGETGVGCGEVFQVAPPAEPGTKWTYSAIYEFTGRKDGCCVSSSLTLDSAGRLYGVNVSLFQLTQPSQPGQFWTYSDIYNFTNGYYPLTPLLIDSAGALYAVAFGGSGCGGLGCGAVLQFVPSQGKWTENILYKFTGGSDGALPDALTIDPSSGALYGLANAGGLVTRNCSDGCGTVFKLAPAQAGTWTYSVLYSFTGKHDSDPYGNIVRDASGNLYGLALRNQLATEVFQLHQRKPTGWTRTVLHSFGPTQYPPTYLTIGPNSVLYGAVFGNIDLYYGRLFSLTPPTGKGPWVFSTVWDFNQYGPDLNPNGVVVGLDGALYGTLNGGDADGGDVFRLRLPQLTGPNASTRP